MSDAVDRVLGMHEHSPVARLVYLALREEGAMTASELADAVGMNRSGMNKRLDDLVERGLVREKTVGASAVVYWLSDEGKGELRGD